MAYFEENSSSVYRVEKSLSSGTFPTRVSFAFSFSIINAVWLEERKPGDREIAGSAGEAEGR